MDTKEAGRKGGLSRSAKKQAASRANGARRKAAPSAPPASPAPAATRVVLFVKPEGN
jgi:hypothetical protein